jgi:hypothetical protein
MAIQIPIWPGSSSFFSVSASYAANPLSTKPTPFGFFDSDAIFKSDADNVANWCATRLGYPIIDIELQDINFFACFEEAANEYSSQINQYRAKENLLSLQGSNLNNTLANKQINNNMQGVVNLAKDYGTEAKSGGRLTHYTASFTLTSGQQIYNLNDSNVVSLESGSVSDGLTIRRVFHQAPPAIVRFFDPFVGTGLGSQQMMDTFGFGNYSPGISFMMQPMHDDLLRLQAIEFNDQIRKSQFSFELINNRIKIFPLPVSGDDNTKIYFEYTLNSEANDPIIASNVVSDFSNVPFERLSYTAINSAGRQWITKYTLALAKEVLGAVRAKFSAIPIPGADITLDGGDLRSEAAAEKEALLTQLKEMLEATSKRALMEAKRDEAEFLESTLARIPRPIYIG